MCTKDKHFVQKIDTCTKDKHLYKRYSCLEKIDSVQTIDVCTKDRRVYKRYVCTKEPLPGTSKMIKQNEKNFFLKKTFLTRNLHQIFSTGRNLAGSGSIDPKFAYLCFPGSLEHF